MPPKPPSPEEQKLKDFLITLGLSSDQSKIYQALIRFGNLTPLELSRKTAIPRTRVYRTLDSMRTLKLVEEVIDEHRTLAGAVPPDRLQKLLTAKQAELDHLTSLFPKVQTYLNQQINRRQSDTQVKFYRGIDGIKQMAWNELNATKEIVGYTATNFETAVGSKFARDFYQEIIDHKLMFRDIYSDRYLESVGGLKNLQHQTDRSFPNSFESRYLDQDTLDIIHTMDIYNDVVAFYNWVGDDIFGVEIYNAKVAKMQHQIFDILWLIAVPESELLKKDSTS